MQHFRCTEEGSLDESYPFDWRRQGPRVRIRVPVEARAAAADGSFLEEETHTESVGARGAMIRMHRSLEIGAELEITNRFSQQTAKFRVVWLKTPQTGDSWEVGLESFQPLGDFWGVRFPPKARFQMTFRFNRAGFVILFPQVDAVEERR
jgi:hypothetical protein